MHAICIARQLSRDILESIYARVLERDIYRAIGGGEKGGECTGELILRQFFQILNSTMRDWEHDLFSIILLVKHKYNLL